MTKSKLQTWLSDVRSRIAKVLSWTRAKFKSTPALTNAQPGTAAAKKEGLDDEEFYEIYLRKLSGMDDIVVKMGLYERLGASLKYFYEMGRRDGALGIRLNSFADIAKSNAYEIFQHIYVVLKGKLAALKAEFDAVSSMKQSDESAYLREQAYYDYAKYQYRFFPRSHSIGLFLLYFLVAVLLIFADIPLAIELIRQGFNLPGGEFRNLFLGNFRKTIAENWEIFLTSFGISLCTVYIKIYYDEIVGTPFANRFMTFKQFLAENNIQSPADKAEVEKEHRRKFRWKTAFFVVTLLSIVALALFRLETAGNIKNSEHSFDVNVFSAIAFIAITILFPLIGGICLSYSLNNLQNRMRLWRARSKSRNARRRWVQAVRTTTTIEKNYRDMAAAEERLSDEPKQVEEYRIYLLASYERGYAIGGMQPQKYMKGEDFFTKILEWRNIAVSRKINSHIGNLGNE
jgi:hypothetical protein